MAAYFREEFNIPFRLLIDHDQETYKALDIKRGTVVDLMGPAVWYRFAKGVVSGKGMAVAKQDVLQMGGVIVVDKGGEVLFEHRSQTSADNAPVSEVLAALP